MLRADRFIHHEEHEEHKVIEPRISHGVAFGYAVAGGFNIRIKGEQGIAYCEQRTADTSN